MIILKKKAARLLRSIHILQFVDKLMFIGSILKNRKLNQSFMTEHPDFIPPPAYLAFDAYNHTNWQAYYDMGLIHSSLISDLISEHISEKEIKICEWGCGPARVIRHLEKINGFNTIELFGTDYNSYSIKWCNRHIKNVHFFENDLKPPLSIENETFDCVYAISVFTHLSENMHYAWIRELFRVLKPNGILIFTTHGDLCAERLLHSEKSQYDSGELVIIDKIQEGKKHFAAYHPPQFVKNVLLKDYLLIKQISNPIQYQLQQEVWVVRKKRI